MPRTLDDIQRDIDQTRANLAATLDQLAASTQPAALIDSAKSSLSNAKNLAIVAGSVVAGIVVIALVRRTNKNRQIKELTVWLERH
ncbi:MAG: DUF3618 domain-containing protein [Corynebacterium sp.]|nr:DUF3618 domain-containing protein [Corynebacterium sp.]